MPDSERVRVYDLMHKALSLVQLSSLFVQYKM